MSRTYKTRPRWVQLNDPKFPTVERHDHLIKRSEPTGRMIESAYQPYWDGFGPKPEPIMYAEKRYWTEVAPCDIDKPERSYRDSRKTWGTDEEKRCDKRPLIKEPCSCCSRWYAKKLDVKAKRSSINQQLHNAVRDYGWTADPEEWYDVDISEIGTSEDWKFWD